MPFVYIYPTAVTLLFIGMYTYLIFKINSAEKRKLKSINKREITDAVETESPIKNHESNLKKHGITGIEGRFSFIRKAFPFVVIPLWGIIIIVPFLDLVPSVYISVIAAVLSVVAGVSLRPFLENLFSGIVISFFKSIKIGDTVIIDGQYGLIEEISLTYSVLKRWDWNRIIIPNSKLLEKEIEHLTMNDHFIWAHIEFYVSPEASIEKVGEIAKDVAAHSKYFNDVEDPTFWVMGLEKDTIKCWIAAWANSPSEAWELRNDIRTNLIKALQREGIKFHEYNISPK